MRWSIWAVTICAGCQAASPITARMTAVRATPLSPIVIQPPPPFCTRTLGLAACFAYPESLPDHPSGWGDTPVRPFQPKLSWWEQVKRYWEPDIF